MTGTTMPAWMDPVVEGARSITAKDLSRFVPPEDDPSLRRGAVLMLFGDGPSGPDLLLTERAHDLRSHPGQISFPGGSIDPDDATPVDAALREAEEETGLTRDAVEVFATLPDLWLPPSNFAVTPVLAWERRRAEVGVVDPGEVNAILRVPIAELLDPAHRITVFHPATHYTSPGFLVGPEGESKELILWGFTAGIITRLFDHVGWTRPWDATVRRQLPGYMLGLSED